MVVELSDAKQIVEQYVRRLGLDYGVVYGEPFIEFGRPTADPERGISHSEFWERKMPGHKTYPEPSSQDRITPIYQVPLTFTDSQDGLVFATKVHVNGDTREVSFYRQNAPTREQIMEAMTARRQRYILVQVSDAKTAERLANELYKRGSVASVEVGDDELFFQQIRDGDARPHNSGKSVKRSYKSRIENPKEKI